MEVIGYAVIAISAIAKSVMDVIQFNFFDSVFHNLNRYKWDPALSWTNKYKLGDPKLGPKFPGSTTIFAWLTDAWHLFQMIFLKGIVIGSVLVYDIHGWLGILASMIVFGFVFEVFYRLSKI